ILGYLAIFLQWAVGGYHLCLVGLAVVTVPVFLIFRLPPRARLIAISALALLSLGLSTLRSLSYFERWGDVGRIVYSNRVAEIVREKKKIYLSCYEGALSFSYFLNRYRGLDVPVLVLGSDPFEPGSYVIGDTKMCPI